MDGMGAFVLNCLSLWIAAIFANEKRYSFAGTVSWPSTVHLSTGQNTGEYTNRCAK